MIEIVNLFLALVVGPQVVAVDVSPEVAAVEIVVDGEKVGRADAAPWEVEVDFGDQLRAHRLEAVAYDAAGVEIDRAVRYVNLGHRRQAGRVVLLEGDDGRPEAVRLGWESVGQRQGVGVELFFDGEPVAAEDPRHVPLPDHDPGQFHFVSAVFHFDDGESRHLEVGFGGRLGLELHTELTAVPVLPAVGRRPPKADDLATAFRLAGSDRTLPVHGVEKGRAEVVVVRDDDVQPHVEELAQRIGGGPGRSMWSTGSAVSSAREEHEGLLASEKLSRFARLPTRSRVRLLAPRAAPLLPVGVSRDMFVVSPPVDAAERGLLAAAVEEPPQRFDKQLASAVALAGKVAQGSNRPRAVVLILGASDGDDDASRVSSVSVRAYLRDLGVPLFVWAWEPLPPDTGWGPIRSLGPADDPGAMQRSFAAAVNELEETLQRQRLVWLEGSHLPREIELAPDVADLRFAGREEGEPFR